MLANALYMKQENSRLKKKLYRRLKVGGDKTGDLVQINLQLCQTKMYSMKDKKSSGHVISFYLFKTFVKSITI